MARSETSKLSFESLDMPGVDDLFNQSMLPVVLDRAFPQTDLKPRKWPEVGAFVQFVRLVDKALREYDAARAALLIYLDPMTPGTHLSSYIRAVDHMDNAVLALARAARLARELRDAGYGRGATKLTERQETRLREFRNTLEHTDERLLRNSPNPRRRVDKGEPYAVRFGNNAMLVGKNLLRYDEFVGDARKLYRMIEAIRGVSAAPDQAFANSKTRTEIAVTGRPEGNTQRATSSIFRELMRLLSNH